ncbi:MAG: DUF885 family protein [Candidatus Marinimicrobia bacterium]|nr:DUF885 family protein [Candidatus Neomarinimicrobiota bacterium]MBL7023681.1 DUF885 family protein [Candidatus Neomarinimicrobiota bacterium]
MDIKKIKIVALIILVMLFWMCGRSQQKSFNDLTQAFFQWYFKSQPVLATELGIFDYSHKFAKYNTDVQDENLADLKRFIIELSQIDRAGLSKKSKIEYDIFTNALDEMVFDITQLREYEWNPLMIPTLISTGISLIIDNSAISMDEKVGYLEGRLSKIPEIVNELQSKLNPSSEIHTKIAIQKVAGLIKYLIELPLSITSDNATLDRIDDLVKNSITSLNDYQQYLISINKESDVTFRLGEDLYLQKFKYVISNETTPGEVYQSAQKTIIDVQNQMFDIALPFYLIENDEPVWVDRSDTLNVIDWTIGSLEQDLPIINLFSEKIDNSLIELENFIKVHKILRLDNNERFILRETPDYKMQSSLIDVELLNGNQNDVLYNIQIANAGKYSDVVLDLINMNQVYPGYLVLERFKMDNSSQISKIFSDEVFASGWQYYCEGMMIEAGYKSDNSQYKLLQLSRLLKIAIDVILDQDIHMRDMSQNQAVKLMVNEGFYSNISAEKNWIKAQLNYCKMSSGFIGTQAIWNLRRDVELQENNNFDLSEFHEELLSQGSIPIRYIRNIISK